MANSSDDTDITFKIVVVGESGVGKTNILSRYINDKFFVGQNTTIGIEFSTRIIDIQGEKVKVQLWDTAGQERYRALASVFYKNSVGALMVFDLTSRETFMKLAKWVTEIKEQAAHGIVIMLIGNKSDLPNRQVTTDEALDFAQQQKMAYMETSAKVGTNVQTAFDRLFAEIYTHYKTSDKAKEAQNPEQHKPVPLKKSVLEDKQQNKKKICC